MARKGGLGKGLDSLISSSYVKEVQEEKKTLELSTSVDKSVDKPVETDNSKPEMMVKVSQIEPNREQPRKIFDEEALQELAESIRQYGVLQPLIVKQKGKRYEIIAGERRWRAAKLAKVKEVPVIVREYTDQEIMEIALIENIQREDLNPIEEAQAFMRLIQEFHLKQEELAKKVSKSRTVIANRMRLLKLAPTVQQMLIDGNISEGHARALLAIEDTSLQESAALQIMDQSLNVRETEKLVKRLLNPPMPKEEDNWKERDQLIYDNLEEDLRKRMGTKVVIQRKDVDKGRIQIDYYSLEEFERLMDLFRSMQ